MNIPLPLFGLLVAALALAPLAARAAAKPDAAPAPEAPPPKSVFVIDPQVSKDPFFPKTTRLRGIAPRTNDVVVIPSSQFPAEIRINGVSTLSSRRIAIVNGKSIEKGERIEIPIRGQRIPVRCLEMTEKTIVLEANGISQELALPVGLPAPTQPQ